MVPIILKDSHIYIPYSPKTKTKVYIMKGANADIYSVIKEQERNVYPLQYGNGNYTIKIYQLVSGNKYHLITQKNIKAVNTTLCYLKPTQYVWYKDNITKLSAQISANRSITAYYNYCYNQITYDYIKAFTLAKKTDYLPDLDDIIKKKRGICIDKAALLCALCRSNNIPCKLAIGYVAKKTYHAWCLIWHNKKWEIFDPTYGKKYKPQDYQLERTC